MLRKYLLRILLALGCAMLIWITWRWEPLRLLGINSNLDVFPVLWNWAIAVGVKIAGWLQMLALSRFVRPIVNIMAPTLSLVLGVSFAHEYQKYMRGFGRRTRRWLVHGPRLIAMKGWFTRIAILTVILSVIGIVFFGTIVIPLWSPAFGYLIARCYLWTFNKCIDPVLRPIRRFIRRSVRAQPLLRSARIWRPWRLRAIRWARANRASYLRHRWSLYWHHGLWGVRVVMRERSEIV